MTPPRQPAPPRFIDLQIDWLAQYANETNLFDDEAKARATADLPRIEGYLGATSAACLVIDPNQAQVSPGTSPWSTIANLVARHEAEFCGRLLIGRDDFLRWQDDTNGLTWAILGLRISADLIRLAESGEHLSKLFDRGIRLVQPSGNFDDRGVLHALLNSLLAWTPKPIGALLLLDLASLDAASQNAALEWFEEQPDRAERLLLIRSHGPIDLNQVARIRHLGGFVALGGSLKSFDSLASLRISLEAVAQVPRNGSPGYEGIGLATEAFLGGKSLPGAETAADFVAWATKTLAPEVARAVCRDNAVTLFAQLMGIEPI